MPLMWSYDAPPSPLRQALGMLLLLLLLCQPLLSLAAETAPLSDDVNMAIPADIDLQLRTLLDEAFDKYDTMGASVVVFENGKITFIHTYGLRTAATAKIPGESVTEDTLFQVGSISKMIAGMGLLRLVDDGKATLDSELSSLFGFPVVNPYYPKTPVTLRQLMTHTAGMRDSGSYNMALEGKPRPLPDLLGGRLSRLSFLSQAKSGARVQYSNFGGGVAGSLIEALSGQTIDQYLSDRIFTPLGITASFQASMLPEDLPLADMYDMPAEKRSKSLREDLVTAIVTPDPEHNYFLTAGKLTISAPDLAKLLIVLCDGGAYDGTRILKESTTQEMRTPQNARGSVTGQSDRGLFMNIITNYQVPGRTMYGHGGKANGMLCAAYFDPVDRTGVVMLTNGCNNAPSYYGVGMLGRIVLALCYEELIDVRHVWQDPWLVLE